MLLPGMIENYVRAGRIKLAIKGGHGKKGS